MVYGGLVVMQIPIQICLATGKHNHEDFWHGTVTKEKHRLGTAIYVPAQLPTVSDDDGLYSAATEG